MNKYIKMLIEHIRGAKSKEQGKALERQQSLGCRGVAHKLRTGAFIGIGKSLYLA